MFKDRIVIFHKFLIWKYWYWKFGYSCISFIVQQFEYYHFYHRPM